MSLSFTTSVVLLLLDARDTHNQFQAQEDEISSLRKIALAQWPFDGVVITLDFTAERWKSLLDRYTEVGAHTEEELNIDHGVVYYTPDQDTTPHAMAIFPDDDDYKDFKGFVNEICTFTIMLNDQSELARCEVDKWPEEIEISDKVKMTFKTFKPPGLRVADFDNAEIRVHIETGDTKDAPVSITLHSLDRHLLFLQQPIIPQWIKASREVEGQLREPYTIDYLESKPQLLEVDFPGIFPPAQR